MRIVSCVTSPCQPSGKPPGDRFASAQWHQRIARQVLQRSRNCPVFFNQSDLRGIARQAVPVGAVVTGKGFECVECARLVEGFGVKLDGGVGRIASSAAASRFLRNCSGMRG